MRFQGLRKRTQRPIGAFLGETISTPAGTRGRASAALQRSDSAFPQQPRHRNANSPRSVSSLSVTRPIFPVVRNSDRPSVRPAGRGGTRGAGGRRLRGVSALRVYGAAARVPRVAQSRRPRRCAPRRGHPVSPGGRASSRARPRDAAPARISPRGVLVRVAFGPTRASRREVRPSRRRHPGRAAEGDPPERHRAAEGAPLSRLAAPRSSAPAPAARLPPRRPAPPPRACPAAARPGP